MEYPSWVVLAYVPTGDRLACPVPLPGFEYIAMGGPPVPLKMAFAEATLLTARTVANANRTPNTRKALFTRNHSLALVVPGVFPLNAFGSPAAVAPSAGTTL